MAEVPAEGMVPPVVAPAVVAYPDIHAVLAICGFANVMDCTSIINNEGFQPIADFGVLEDKDVFEMVKRLGNRTVVAGCVNIGVIQVKKLQALCYWVCDQQKHRQVITQDDWDDDMVMAFLLSLSMMPNGTCISYPLHARLKAWTMSQFTVC